MKISAITLRGQKIEATKVDEASEDLLKSKGSFVIGASMRGGTETHEVTLEEDDVVELVFDDGTVWFASQDTLDEIYPEASQKDRSGATSFEIPLSISTSTDRGLFGKILLKLVNIFTKKPLTNKIKELAINLEKKQLEQYSGLYRLNTDFSFHDFARETCTEPYLLFLHGTSSSTKGSFGELVGTEAWEKALLKYKGRMLAFQHETLSKNPLQNVLELVKALPDHVTLHLVSQSRGGLVGDVLSRFCTADETRRGFSDQEMELLKKSYPDVYFETLKNLVEEINEVVSKKKITVSKYIRVACPAGGTILASKRLDHFFNILFNLIGVGIGWAASPVYVAFKNLVAAVVNTKNDVNALPGLEVQNPESPFMKALNNPSSTIVADQTLLVISGNSKMKLNLRALLVIATKLFYWEDNDMVVNTSSMYKGAKRAGSIQYFFDEGAEVDHFHYFKNQRTNKALADALEAAPGAMVPGFSLMSQLAAQGMDRNALLKLEGGEVFTNTVTGAKPIVVLLPGIMGSTLAEKEDAIWINYFKFIAGGLKRLEIKADDNIKASALIKSSYKALVDRLSGQYDVVTFPFDWRLQLNSRAKLLHDRLLELLSFRQPIKIVGHSMGGVLVRDLMVTYPKTWKQLNDSKGFQLLFLGSPLGGSFRIPAVLFGQDGIINKLSKIDIFHTKKELIEMFSRMPGLLSLLPLTKQPGNDFSEPETWKAMKNATNDVDWPIPQNDTLTEFRNYREAILAVEKTLDLSKAVYIAGRDLATPCAYRIDGSGNNKDLVFLSTAEGDQSVTWESGIPKAMIEKGNVYYSNVTHGSLANDPSLFKAIEEVLALGATNLLSKNRPVIRGEEKLFRQPISFDYDLSPESLEKTLLGLSDESKTAVSQTPMKLSISHGDLLFSTYPVFAGHFAKDGILYAEKAIDYNLNRALSERHAMGLYPGEIGTSEVLISNQRDFKGAVIVGLGDPGKLTPFLLSRTIEHGVVNYLLSLNSKTVVKKDSSAEGGRVGISSLIIGCGYGGLSVDNSVRAIVEGVQSANQKIKNLYSNQALTVDYVEFMEQYEDKAISCFYAISQLANQENRLASQVRASAKIKTLPGSKKRIPVDTSEVWWNRITVSREVEANGLPYLKFNTTTGSAREDQRELYTSPKIIDELVNAISEQDQWSTNLAKTIFELLIPNDFKTQLKRNGSINWIVDKYSAAYPWELLQDNAENAKPLCVSAGMIRQLATKSGRTTINAVSENNALVIADPDLKGFLGQLPGALEEGKLVDQIFREKGYNQKCVLKGSAPEIIQAMFSQNYKMIHLAGHGLFDSANPAASGMAIGNNVFLSTREISQMSTVPELVFVNCCYLGKTDGASEAYFQNRYKMAANIGTQLIENGVKAVVAAGWAVDDEAALEFTRVFYREMFAGANFGDAITTARQTLFEKFPDTNTWGAYQCYGDPFYRITMRGMAAKKSALKYVIAEEAEVDLSNLLNQIELGSYPTDFYSEKLEEIISAVEEAGIRNAGITQFEAFAYFELCDYKNAQSKFSQLLQMEEAHFSFTAIEKYCMLRTRKAVVDYGEKTMTQKDGLKEIDQAIADLKSLIGLGGTANRYSLLGSLYKQRALLLPTKTDKDKKSKQATYMQAALQYYLASKVKNTPYLAIHITNWLEMETILVALGARKWGEQVPVDGQNFYELPKSQQEATDTAIKYRDAMLQVPAERMNYWDRLSVAYIEQCLLMLNIAEYKEEDGIQKMLELYKKTWEKAGSKAMKKAEIEHCDFFADAFAFDEAGYLKPLLKMVNDLKAELEKLI